VIALATQFVLYARLYLPIVDMDGVWHATIPDAAPLARKVLDTAAMNLDSRLRHGSKQYNLDRSIAPQYQAIPFIYKQALLSFTLIFYRILSSWGWSPKDWGGDADIEDWRSVEFDRVSMPQDYLGFLESALLTLPRADTSPEKLEGFITEEIEAVTRAFLARPHLVKTHVRAPAYDITKTSYRVPQRGSLPPAPDDDAMAISLGRPDECPKVMGEPWMRPLKPAQYAVLEAALVLSTGMSTDQLITRSKQYNAVNIFRNLRRTCTRMKCALVTPIRKGAGTYRVASMKEAVANLASLTESTSIDQH
jgi:hypothetical protein